MRILAKFDLGSWVIDTKRHDAVTVVTVLDSGTEPVYVVETDEEDLYLVKESHLIPYDKYYFDTVQEE